MVSRHSIATRNLSRYRQVPLRVTRIARVADLSYDPVSRSQRVAFYSWSSTDPRVLAVTSSERYFVPCRSTQFRLPRYDSTQSISLGSLRCHQMARVCLQIDSPLLHGSLQFRVCSFVLVARSPPADTESRSALYGQGSARCTSELQGADADLRDALLCLARGRVNVAGVSSRPDCRPVTPEVLITKQPTTMTCANRAKVDCRTASATP